MEVIEEWASIVNYDNYEVSTLGNVRNIKTGRILKPACKGGYMSIGLSNKSKCITTQVHRLVAKAFIENPENKPQVNHKDKNRSNNNLINLEWATGLENNIHRSKGIVQTTNQNLRVWRICMETNEKLELYNSMFDAASWCVENGYTTSLHNTKGYISSVINGYYKSSAGFIWQLDEQQSLQNEIWKTVKMNNTEFDNYFVSNLGRFKNSKGVIMTNYKPHHSGYIYVRVNRDKYGLHRLVASTFIDNIENKPVVNHIDGNKTNNSVTNLEWVTVKENNQHNHNAGLIKCFTRKIAQYDLQLNKLKEFNSIVQAERELHITTIKKVLHNKQKTAGGFIWKYLD
jgi:hypothetical protein